MSWTAPSGHIYATGEVVTAATMNTYVEANLAFLGTPPSCRAYNSANILIPNNAATALTFDSERWDTDTIHSTSVNTGRLTANTSGVYAITGHAVWAAVAAGVRQLFLRVNGTAVIAYCTIASVGAANNTDQPPIATLYHLNATDFVELLAFQTSGAALNIVAGALYSPEFAMQWLGF